MKTKTVERLLQETPEDVKKSVSDYADALVKRREDSQETQPRTNE